MTMQILCDWCGQVIPEDEQDSIFVRHAPHKAGDDPRFQEQDYDCHSGCITRALQEIAFMLNGDHPKGE